MKKFNLELKSKKPLWKEFLVFCCTVVCVWGSTHVFMNYSAFAEIATFKLNTLKTSVMENLENLQYSPATAKAQEEPESELATIKPKRSVFRNQKLKPRNQASELFAEMPIFPPDNRLVLPRIGKNVPLATVPTHNNWHQLETNIQDGLRNGVVVHPISHAPGTLGNFFATGHSSYYKWDPGRFKDVFALLHEVKVGDVVEVYWEGQLFKYKIREQKVVPPTEISVLNQPKDKSILTLMTCTPVGTNKNRLILVGDLKD